MKILVPVKRVIDPYLAVRIDAGGMDIVSEQQPHTLNPFDAAALAFAAQLRRDGRATELVAVTIGPARAADILRTALAMGADRALHLVTEDAATPPPFATATALAGIVGEERPDIVLIGKQASDDDAHETAPLLAGCAGLPFLPDAYRIHIETGRAAATFDLDGTPTTAEAPLPCLIACDLHLAEPGPVGLAQVMQARRKPVASRPFTAPADLPPEPQRLGLTPPPARPPCRLIDSVDELLALLQQAGGEP
jgi:electron transfer flavoprotein beta subunit